MRHIWSFADCVLDEANRLLTVAGVAVEIEAKPLDILIELLRHAGDVVTKEELLDTVWPGVIVVEGSLTTALSKLRKTLGERGGAAIVTVPRFGYRLAAPVTVKSRPEDPSSLPIEPGMVVPGRPNWRFAERLGRSPHADVWRIAHEKTQARHVLKLARDAAHLRALKREVAIRRLLALALGERPDLVPMIDWNFADAPFFIESPDGGPSLPAWAASQGDLRAVPLAMRIELLAGIAETVAAAHGVGVLHKDLKPANILVARAPDGPWQPVVVDFGSAALLEQDGFVRFGITHSMVTAQPGEAATSGTAPWMAPELLAGGGASIASDVYALGVMLYQLAIGDLRLPLAAGWEAEIADSLLREDIAAAAAGDPSRRMGSAGELARRLRDREPRRAALEKEAELARRAALAEARLARLRARRPWMIAAACVVVIGAGVSGALAVRAARARDAALRQTHIADTISHFLANDLLARTNPFHAGAAEETLVEAVKQASPLIDARFAGEPAIAARLHQTIANAFDRRSDWAQARGEYARAAALWAQAGKAAADDSIVNQLQSVMMEARSYQDGSLKRARTMLADAESRRAPPPAMRADIPVWLASAHGMVALVANDLVTAQHQFALAADGAAQLPDFDPVARLTFRQRLAFTKIRLGDGPGAEHDFRALTKDYAALEGPDGPDALMTRMNLTQALMISGHHAAVVVEADALYPKLVARLGQDHEMTLQLLTTKAQSEGMLGRWADTIRDDLAVHERALRKAGPRSFFAVASLVDAATAQCRAGQVAEGLTSAHQAHDDALAGFGKAGLSDAAAYTLAECEIGARQYDSAAGHLNGIDTATVAQLAGDPHWGANVELARARIAAATGQPDEARQHLQACREALTANGSDPYQARLWRDLQAKLDESSHGAIHYQK